MSATGFTLPLRWTPRKLANVALHPGWACRWRAAGRSHAGGDGRRTRPHAPARRSRNSCSSSSILRSRGATSAGSAIAARAADRERPARPAAGPARPARSASMPFVRQQPRRSPARWVGRHDRDAARNSSPRSAAACRCSSTAGFAAAATSRRRSRWERRPFNSGARRCTPAAAGGQPGVERALELLRAELDVALCLLGAAPCRRAARGMVRGSRTAAR